MQAMGVDHGTPVNRIKVDGGACKNNLLMQMQADFAGVQVVRPVHVETTSFGAVFLAGLGAGIWQSTDAIRERWLEDRTFEPEVSVAHREEVLSRWAEALGRVDGFET